MSLPTAPDTAPFVRQIPTYWEGALAPLTQMDTFPLVLGALARTLGRHPAADDEDRRLVHALLSVSGPIRDRVWVGCQRGGSALTLPEALVELRRRGHDLERDGLSGWCAGLDFDYAHSFELEPAEFQQRCLPHYHGFLHAWTDEHTARSRYRDWPLLRQAEFQHEYLLYAQNDASFAAGSRTRPDAELQAAASWLLSRRRCILKWTLSLAEHPAAPPARVAQFEGLLIASLQTASEQLKQNPEERWALQVVTEVLTGLYQPPAAPSAFEQLLEWLECDGGRLRTLGFWARASALRHLYLGPESAAAPALAGAVADLDEASRWLW